MAKMGLSTNRNRLTDIENKWLPEGEGEKGKLGVWDYQVQITIYKMDTHQGPTVLHMEPYSISFNYNGKESKNHYVYIY